MGGVGVCCYVSDHMSRFVSTHHVESICTVVVTSQCIMHS